jgi:hypothetical protein
MSDTFAIVSTTDTPTKGKQMSKTKLFSVSYDGYLLISAEDQDEAFAIAMVALAKSGLVNDGDSGEWGIADITEEGN